jgi:hypothetical protein
MTITMKRNDREPALRATLLHNGEPVPLSGSTVKLIMKLDSAAASAAPKVDAAATIVGDDEVDVGVVEYAWADGDTDTIGTYRAEFEVTFANGKTRSFPGADYLLVRIIADLG